MLAPDILTPRFVLSCLAESDVTETYLSWLVDPEVNQYLETRHSASSRESLLAFVGSMRSSQHSYFFGIFDKATRAHHGNIKLGPVSEVHGTATIGLVIGDKAVWGTGVASESIAAVSDWAFGTLGLAKLTAGSYARNQGSVRAFTRNGWSEEGRQLSQVRLDDGSRDDVIILGRVRPTGEAVEGPVAS